jgi:hypothetical protein
MVSLYPMNKLEEARAAAVPAIPAWIKYSLIHPAISYALIAIRIFAPGIVSYFLMCFVVIANFPGDWILSLVSIRGYGPDFPFTMPGLWSLVVLMVPFTWLFIIFPLCWAANIFTLRRS